MENENNKKQWFHRSFGDRESLMAFLNRLSNKGIPADCIKVSSSTFGSDVFYYNDKELSQWVSDDENTLDKEAEYFLAVKNLAKDKSDFIFNNSSHKNASIALSVMAENTKKELRIYFSKSIPEFEEKFYPSLEKFAEKKGNVLKVVLDDNMSHLSDLLKPLQNKYPDRISVKKKNEKFVESISMVYNRHINCVVADSVGFRIEDVSEYDHNPSMFCFNRTKAASALRKAFDENFNSCDNFFNN